MEKSSFLPFAHTYTLWVWLVISGKKNFNSSTQIFAPSSFHSLRKLSHENDSTIKTNLNWSGENFLSFWLHFLTPHFLMNFIQKFTTSSYEQFPQVDTKSFFLTKLTTIFSSCEVGGLCDMGMRKVKMKILKSRQINTQLNFVEI